YFMFLVLSLFFFACYGDHRDLHSFPTRRSSDLKPKRSIVFVCWYGEERGLLGSRFYGRNPVFPLKDTIAMVNLEQVGRTDDVERSEEHTSELQSRENLVCRLLLEKKKKEKK